MSDINTSFNKIAPHRNLITSKFRYHRYTPSFKNTNITNNIKKNPTPDSLVAKIPINFQLKPLYTAGRNLNAIKINHTRRNTVNYYNKLLNMDKLPEIKKSLQINFMNKRKLSTIPPSKDSSMICNSSEIIANSAGCTRKLSRINNFNCNEYCGETSDEFINNNKTVIIPKDIVLKSYDFNVKNKHLEFAEEVQK